MPRDLPSPELLRKLLRYEPETGKLFWRERTPEMFESKKQTAEQNCAIWNGKYAGKEAFTGGKTDRYFHGRVFNKDYYAHRVAWAIYTGAWPLHQIDHINGDKKDNRIENLRVASHAQNMRNRGKQTNNTSGYKGVIWDKNAQKWMAQIQVDGVNTYLGRFRCAKKAYAAYCEAAVKLHGVYFHPPKL